MLRCVSTGHWSDIKSFPDFGCFAFDSTPLWLLLHNLAIVWVRGGAFRCPLSSHISKRHSSFGDFMDLAQVLGSASWGFLLLPSTCYQDMLWALLPEQRPDSLCVLPYQCGLPALWAYFLLFLVTRDHSGGGYPTDFLDLLWVATTPFLMRSELNLGECPSF